CLRVFKPPRKAALGPAPGPATAAGVDRLRLLRMPSTPAGGAHGGRMARSINQDRNYQKNLKALIKASLDPDSGLLPPSVRIVGGVLDRDNQFPECVAVGGEDGYCCTGMLIARDVRPTARPCF